jgi:ADP-ribose pyrophosphatase YjhB (NUDIX family)
VQHRISAGALVEQDGRILLVRHEIPGQYNFWVAPGGGVQDTESLAQAAERETFEETGLRVRAEQMLFIEEFHQPSTRHCKFWFAARVIGGDLDATNPLATAEHIKEVAWRRIDELASSTVFPTFLRTNDWQDVREQGGPIHLGLRAMEFW